MSQAPIQERIHAPIHGLLPSDNGIEMFADLKTRSMHFMYKGLSKPFSELPPKVGAALMKKYMSDAKAMKELQHLPINQAIERFAFCLYGAADHLPDVDENGELQQTDNFRCCHNCTCLDWESKNIGNGSFYLTKKEIHVIDALSKPGNDDLIAKQLGITISTLNTHKKNLFTKLNVFSTKELVMKCTQQKIIQ